MDPILVWGAGAIGGSVAAWLKRAGHDVTVVDIEAAHVEAIRTTGLRITGPIDEFTVQMPALVPAQVGGTWKHIFLAVKAHHTEAACRALTPYLAQDGYVLSLQNGLCELIIQRIVGRDRTVGAFVNFSADWIEPGEIMFGGRGAVVLGELNGRHTVRLDELHKVMRDFEPNAIMTDAIWGYLWGKLGYGAMLFAQALGDKGIADCLARPELLPVWRALGREAVEVALAEGVEPQGFNGFDPARLHAERLAGRGIGLRRRDGRVQPAEREDPFRRVARLGGAQAPHRGRCADRADRRGRRPPRHRLPDHGKTGADDPRGGRRHPQDDRRQPAGADPRMNIRFDGKLVLVSGAGHGFGRTIARTFASLGAKVHGCDLSAAELAETASGTDIQTRVVDLTDRDAAAAWVHDAELTGPVFCLVNNAGGVAGQVPQAAGGRSLRRLGPTVRHQCRRGDGAVARGGAEDEGGRRRADRQHQFGCRAAGVVDRHPGILQRQARGGRPDPAAGA